MSKKLNLLLLFLCLSVSIFAQTAENLKLRETELQDYEKGKILIRYENEISLDDAQTFDKQLRLVNKNVSSEIYKAPAGSAENSYLASPFESARWTIYQKNGNQFTRLYQSQIFRDGYHLDLKFYEGANRSLILGVKREGVGDYIDTEVFELANGRVRYLGNIPVGLIDDAGNVDSFIGNAEVSYQAGNYRIKINGKSYIPAGKRSPYKNTLIGTNVVYVYNGKVLRRGK